VKFNCQQISIQDQLSPSVIDWLLVPDWSHASQIEISDFR
jgi:hypothetical protein